MKNNSKPSRLSKSEYHLRKERIVAFFILLVVCLIWIFPFIYLFGVSFKPTNELMNPSPKIFPSFGNWTFEHYLAFLNSSNHGRIDNLPIWMMNSLIVTSSAVIVTLVIDTIAAYAFTFFKFKGKKIILSILLASMTIPGVIGMTPMFSMFVTIGKETGLSQVVVKTFHTIVDGVSKTENIYLYPYLWLIFPGVSSVFNLLLMKNFFDSIPQDIIDSARSDGASDFKIFRKIVLPLAKSTILLIVLFTFVNSWNDLLWPQLVTSGNALNFTINVALVNYTGGAGSWDLKAAQAAAAIFALLPILIVFIFVQNKMIDGMASTGVKR